jgi:hypothetical protein
VSEYSEQLLAAALAYAKQGAYVFPVKLGVRGEGKKDVRPIADWDEASTTDPEIIAQWYRGQWAETTIAIDCGKTGIVVADADVSDGKTGPDNLAALPGRAPAVMRVNTPSGGLHDYYREDTEHPVSVDNTGAVAEGVDVRGQGGFVFAPPSRDPRGGSWQWAWGQGVWEDLTTVPRVITERVETAQAGKRPKPSAPSAPAPAYSGGSQLFAAPSEVYDFGPGGGQKTRAGAVALLAAERDAFEALTEVGSGRSHILAQRFGVLAGHGVGVFWSWDDALDTILKACADNGFTAEHGEAYAQQQAARGLEYGMREPWVEKEQADTVVGQDAVDALIAEMISPEEVAGRPAPKALIKGLLNLDSESWIIGEPGSKKSFVAQDMAGHVARGMPWQGLKVTQADVVMIVAEGAGGMSSRVKAWEKAYGPMGTNVRILPRPVQAKDLQKWAVLVEACRRLKPGLIVLDTQARITVGLEENSATEMGIYIEAVRALREATGGCVLTVHHTGRKGGDARGTSAIDGAQHTELKVEVDKSNKLRGRLLVEKQKDMEMRSPLLLGFEVKVVGVDEDGDDLTSLVLMPSDVWADSQAQERPEEPGREIVVREPEDWTFLLFEHNRQDAKRRILQVIKDLAGETGRTEAQIRKTVAERWYGGQVGRVGGTLNEQTWNGHWTGVMAASWSEGKVIVPGSVGGWMISPDYLLEINKAG